MDLDGGNGRSNDLDVTLVFAPPPVSATAVDNPAHLDASGVAGGGSIRIDADNVVAITATRGLDASATGNGDGGSIERSEEHTSELQSLMRTSYAVFCLKKKNKQKHYTNKNSEHNK